MKIFRSGNKKGIALVYIAILIVALIGFLGLVIDIGYMYVAKGQLQKAADSAALAGAARLPVRRGSDPTAFGFYSSVRREAWRFACKNVVVPTGTNVFLVDDYATDCNSLPTGVDLNNANNPDGDIVVGHWNRSSGFRAASFSNSSTINAVQIVTRRTAEPQTGGVRIGDNPVQTFFGRIFSLLPGGGVGWPLMSAGAKAVAINEPFIAPIPICLPSCSLDTPLNGRWSYDKNLADCTTPADESILCTDENSSADSPPGQMFLLSPSAQADCTKILGTTSTREKMPGIAWTNFDISDCPAKPCNMPSPKEILPYVQGTKEPPDICNKNICTTNADLGNFIERYVKPQFEKNKRNFNIGGTTVTGWHVLVPVVSDTVCGETKQTCPGAQGGDANPYYVQGFANVLITEVGRFKGEHGIRLVGFANSPTTMPITVNCKGVPQTINRIVTRIGSASGSCIDCNSPLDAPPFPPRLVE